MEYTSINLDETAVPQVQVLALLSAKLGHCVSISLSRSVRVTCPGINHVSLAYLRLLSARITAAADELSSHLNTNPRSAQETTDAVR